MLDLLIFVVLPYISIALALVVTPYRYISGRLTWSAYSTQFLERKSLFWGSVPWHYGVILLLAGHALGFLFPSAVQSLLSSFQRLIVMESLALGLGLLTLLGTAVLLYRRVFTSIRTVSNFADYIIVLLVLNQAITGVYMGLFARWGMEWYLHTAVPWLYSLLTFQPNVALVSGLPFVFKIHVLGAFLILAFLPFTKFVHFLFLPLGFLFDPPILYRWIKDRRAKKV